MSNGLSYNDVENMCVDKKGYLWLATGRGLNMFNGKSVEKYFVEEYPQLQNNLIVRVKCDPQNRIWVLSSNGNVTMIDDQRQFHRVGLYENNQFIKTKYMLYGPNGNIVLHTQKGLYIFQPQLNLKSDSLNFSNFAPIQIASFDSLKDKPFIRIFEFDDNRLLYKLEHISYLVNLKAKTIEKSFAFQNIYPLIKWGNDELLAFDRNENEIKLINLYNDEIQYPFKNLKDQFGNSIHSFFHSATKINSYQYLFTTLADGIYIFNTQTNKIHNYRHQFANPSSLSGNMQTSAVVGLKDWIFITGKPNGVNYFNNKATIENINVFTDNNGNGYDNRIYGIASNDNNTYYMGTDEGWLEWKRNTNKTRFINTIDHSIFKRNSIGSIVIDKQGRIWGASKSEGIFVIDKNFNLIQHIHNDSLNKKYIKHATISELVLGPDENIWVSGNNGLCKINSKTFEVDNFIDSTFNQFNQTLTNSIKFDDLNNIWFSASKKGAFHFNFISKQLIQYSTETGLISNSIYDIQSDSFNNVYFATTLGLNIVSPSGKIKTFTQKNGLLIDRTEALLLDDRNRMWIGNDIGLACYNPQDSSLRTFDERYGLSVFGFLVGYYFKMSNGEFFLSTPKGVQYFHPDLIFNDKISLNVLINKIVTKNLVSNITKTSFFKLLSSDNHVTFHFSSVDYSPHERTYYEYLLEGEDKEWTKILDQNSVTYNALSPGTYTFKLRISHDGKEWQDSENEVTIQIASPFYLSAWFIALLILILLASIFSMYKYGRKQEHNKRANLETELVITYFASQINSHKNTDELLWDIAKNCISRLHFTDCIIYLKDDETNMLIQKAAYGPKNPIDFTIAKPIEIPVGKGITGTVAQSGVAEIVNNTKKDKRYIVDDIARNSEIAVPILLDNKVIGIIDSEHEAKNFFTSRHKQILTTIAFLCANQLQKIKAETDSQRAIIELAENKQKAAESRLMSLRLQMNPHFLFNALNSIQQMILSNEELVATRYLSKFSKLLRAVLIHSDKEFISLKEEIDILNMYIQVESVRFKESFSYSLTYDNNVEPEEIRMPTLLIQPFVENAIWHGLMHKDSNRLLKITFKEEGQYLQCIIFDNGIGRSKAREINKSAGPDKKHISKGISVSEERLKTLVNKNGLVGKLEINDLTNHLGESLGTEVILYFPINN
ncbi:MAG TPA: histidine kinase [Chitinophagaceae bacterium]|nr:histidine kinase [Chitinophagaceae bacterium]